MNSRSTVGGFARSAQPPTSIFKISKEELAALFQRESDQSSRLNALTQTHKGTEGILSKLQTEATSGIMGDQADLRRRTTKYNKNQKPKPQRPPFFDSLKDALMDRILILVAIFAVLSIIPGMVVEPSTGWVEGVFILVALFVQVLITAWNDYTKDKKFVALQSLNRDESIPVLRGKKGSMQTVDVWKLVVGDIIQMKPGDKVPADCLVIESANLYANEPIKEQAEDHTITSWTKLHKDAASDPFLFADSYVMGGTCKAVVCCVGEESTRGINDDMVDLSGKETELTRKLDNIGGSLKFIGLISSLVILITSIVVLFFQTGLDEDVGGKIFTKKLIDNITIALIMLIVAIPEGLPLTVEISIAHSVLQMSKYDNVLVRDLESVQHIGLITDLCLGKTGTMTTEEMEVVNFYAQNIFVLNSRKNTLLNCNLDNSILDKIKESIVYNSQAYIEMTENSFYVPVGNGTEVSLLKWLQAAEIPVHEIMATKEGRVLAQVPFDAKLKRSIVAVQHPGMTDTVRIYVKGAPEIVIDHCRNHYDAAGNKVPLAENEKLDLLQKMHDDMTSKSFRAMAFSYCDMSLSDFQNLQATMQGEIDSEEEIRALEQDQTFLAMISLKDPVRDNIKKVIAKANEAKVALRLISGDNLHTTAAVAVDTGILSREEYEMSKQGRDASSIAMNASEFRAEVGDVIRTEKEVEIGDEKKYSYSLSNQQAFNRIIGTLKVIGRAEPEDKLRLVAGLRGMLEQEDDPESGRKVAVVGEGINDIEAFQAANVSFAVQDGTSLARNNASMILQTNDFDSCMRAVMWGRNIYMNVQRFLQFQITCNFSILIVVMVSYCTMLDSALNAVQLIYVNLVMDIIGALALASTRPQTDIAQYQAGQGNIMTPFMYRQILGMTVHMTAIMMVIMYSGKQIFNLEFDNATQTIDKDDGGRGHDKMVYCTLVWNTFIFLQVFNLINCRDVSAAKMHGFTGMFRNYLTWIMLLVIVGVQVAACFTFLGRPIFETAKTGGREFLICVFAAASAILANSILKLIPQRWISKLPTMDEDSKMGGNSKLMSAYQSQADAKGLGTFGKKKEEAAPVSQEASYDEGYQNMQ